MVNLRCAQIHWKVHRELITLKHSGAEWIRYDCPYNLNVLISPQKANQPCLFLKSALSIPFSPLFLLLWSPLFPSELYQQLTGFQPISQGKHNNNQFVGLMHSTSPAVNTNWFLKVLSFRRTLLALVFVEGRRPPFEMAGHTKKTTCFRGKQRQRGFSQ